MNKLELYLPGPRKLFSQGFSKNANISYSRDGLAGHTAVDVALPYASPIFCLTDKSYCYSVMNKDNPDPGRYRAVFTLVETDDGKVYEISYGHCSAIFAEAGKTYNAGDTLALVGNTGTVFEGGREITVAERKAGSHAGAHLHGPQVRPCIRVPERKKPPRFYLKDSSGFLKINGMYYEVIDYDNGFNGCIDPEPFFVEILASSSKVIENAISIATKGVADAANLNKTERDKQLDLWAKLLSGIAAIFRGGR